MVDAAHAADQRISLGDSVYIVSQVCAALHHAHEKTDLEGCPLEIIHCDVSPCNVLVGQDGLVANTMKYLDGHPLNEAADSLSAMARLSVRQTDGRLHM